MIRSFYLIAAFLVLLAVSCKHDPFPGTAPEFTFMGPDVLYTSDSFLLSKDAALWRINPDIGEVTADNYYKAPSSLLNDSQQVMITAITTVKSRAKSVLILKRNASDTVISFNQTIMPLMVSSCNFKGCHGNGSKAGKVDLSNYDATINSLVRYQPRKSLLYLSLIKPDPLRRMPPAGALHEYRIAYFGKWIEQGALNN